MSFRFGLALPAVLCVAAMTASCGGSKASRFYQITPAVDASGSQLSLSERTVVLLDPVILHEYVKRAPIVTRVGENELRLNEYHRWIASIEENLIDVISANLTRMAPRTVVIKAPWVSEAEVDLRVYISVTRFELTEDARAVVEAQWGITRGGRNWSAVRRAWLEAPTDTETGKDEYARGVATLSALVGELCEEIARELNATLDRGVNNLQE